MNNKNSEQPKGDEQPDYQIPQELYYTNLNYQIEQPNQTKGR